MRVMSKGERTRAMILDEALALTSTDGLSGLTIGSLADRLGMSKSGLFAHFGSKEQLQAAVIARAGELFTDVVLKPALEQARGLPRVCALFENWIGWTKGNGLPGGCPMQAATLEFDDKPGPLRDLVAHQQDQLRRFIARGVRQAVEEGHLRPDLDVEQFVFEGIAIAHAFAMNFRLLEHPDAERWARSAIRALVDRARPGPS